METDAVEGPDRDSRFPERRESAASMLRSKIAALETALAGHKAMLKVAETAEFGSPLESYLRGLLLNSRGW